MAWRGILSGLWLAVLLGAARLPVDLQGRAVDPLANAEARLSVLVFLRSDCPISNRYAPEIRRLHARFAPRGVAFDFRSVTRARDLHPLFARYHEGAADA